MKKVAFLISHLYSGSNELFDILCKNPRIMGYKQNIMYNTPLSLEELTSLPHKDSTAAAIWLTDLLFNYQFCCKTLYNICRFIYVIRPPQYSLSMIVKSGIKAEFALRYYCYRLRRICEMARETPGAIVLTWDDIVTGNGFNLLENYLNLKNPLVIENIIQNDLPDISSKEMSYAEGSYEKHLYYLKQQKCLLTSTRTKS